MCHCPPPPFLFFTPPSFPTMKPQYTTTAYLFLEKIVGLKPNLLPHILVLRDDNHVLNPVRGGQYSQRILTLPWGAFNMGKGNMPCTTISPPYLPLPIDPPPHFNHEAQYTGTMTAYLFCVENAWINIKSFENIFSVTS